MSPRVRTADKCLAEHQLEIKGEVRTFACQRAEGHPYSHSTGSISWPRRIQPPTTTALPPPGRRKA